MYYKLKIAHSWFDDEPLKICTLLQIPVGSSQNKLTLHVLPDSSQLHTGLLLTIQNYIANSYRYLSQSDYVACSQVNNFKLCQKTPITIMPREGCNLKFNNCKDWANTVVHDLTNTKILLILEKQMNACLLYTSPSPRDGLLSRMPSSA